jgi:hypothetical protein
LRPGCFLRLPYPAGDENVGRWNVVEGQQRRAAEATRDTSERGASATLRRGIRYEQDWIDWCDEVLTFLKQNDAEA